MITRVVDSVNLVWDAGLLTNTQTSVDVARTPVRCQVDGKPASMGEADRDSDRVWPLLGPKGTSRPLIRGSVVERKTGIRKTCPGPYDKNEEEVVEFYGQLWVIPSPSHRQTKHAHIPPPPKPNSTLGSHLFWIRKDLFRSGCFCAEDCYPVVRLSRFDPTPTQFQINCEGIAPGSISFAPVVKKTMDQRGEQRPKRQPPKKGVEGAPPPPPAAPASKVASPGPKLPASNAAKNASANNTVQVVAPAPPTAPAVQPMDPRYKEMICFNCSWPCHYVGICVEPKKCFICSGTHNVNNCIAWARLQPTAEYFGGAATGLGFYHIDIPVAS
ncbi:hypothetical protein D1007_22620 [Hordeum vulgare]|nr:hypothetical protein D1007_22620 [Hordeum vulgare]